jgi:hypothetical protein
VLAVPSEFKFANNWGKTEVSESTFDSKIVLNQLIGCIIQYSPNPMLEAQVVSDSEVLLRELFRS